MKLEPQTEKIFWNRITALFLVLAFFSIAFVGYCLFSDCLPKEDQALCTSIGGRSESTLEDM